MKNLLKLEELFLLGLALFLFLDWITDGAGMPCGFLPKT